MRRKAVGRIGAQQQRRQQQRAGIADAAGDPEAPLARRENRGGERAQPDQQDRRHFAAAPGHQRRHRDGRGAGRQHQPMAMPGHQRGPFPQHGDGRDGPRTARTASRRARPPPAPAAPARPPRRRASMRLWRSARAALGFARIRARGRPRAPAHDPVLATRPPNRRSRCWYSRMAASSAARSKSGQ